MDQCAHFFTCAGALWNIIDVFIIISGLLHGISALLLCKAISPVDIPDPETSTTAGWDALWHQSQAYFSLILTYNNCVSLFLFFLLFRVFKALRFHRSLSIISQTLTYAKSDLGNIMALFMISLLMWGSAYFVWIGQFGGHSDYSTPGAAIQNLGLLSFGFDDYDEFSTMGNGWRYYNVMLGRLGFFKPLFYWAMIALLYIVLPNIMLAALVDAYEKAKDNEPPEFIFSKSLKDAFLLWYDVQVCFWRNTAFHQFHRSKAIRKFICDERDTGSYEVLPCLIPENFNENVLRTGSVDLQKIYELIEQTKYCRTSEEWDRAYKHHESRSSHIGHAIASRLLPVIRAYDKADDGT